MSSVAQKINKLIIIKNKMRNTYTYIYISKPKTIDGSNKVV